MSSFIKKILGRPRKDEPGPGNQTLATSSTDKPAPNDTPSNFKDYTKADNRYHHDNNGTSHLSVNTQAVMPLERGFSLWARRKSTKSSGLYAAGGLNKSHTSLSSQTSRGNPIDQALEAMEHRLQETEQRIDLQPTTKRKVMQEATATEPHMESRDCEMAFFGAVYQLRCRILEVSTTLQVDEDVHTAPAGGNYPIMGTTGARDLSANIMTELVCIGDDIRQCCMGIPLKFHVDVSKEYKDRALRLNSVKEDLARWVTEFREAQGRDSESVIETASDIDNRDITNSKEET
ncbi:hypothetical protein MKZ38_001020 [Zalerion maritima]|uniref:Uncharacterized protein n=1 Tax=Zalerion maritima TaxID=339359 RepID=A0AAD5WTJ8_9PEZI|nr:hypothetical protein MKZ38_001020 [Zalerion maritima]